MDGCHGVRRVAVQSRRDPAGSVSEAEGLERQVFNQQNADDRSEVVGYRKIVPGVHPSVELSLHVRVNVRSVPSLEVSQLNVIICKFVHLPDGAGVDNTGIVGDVVSIFTLHAVCHML